MKLAIVIGHTRKSPGAFSPHLQQSEYDFNTDIAIRILALAGEHVGVFRRDGHGVAGAYAQAKAWGATAVVELHFNSSANPEAHGTETLWKTPVSETLARSVQAAMVRALDLKHRGAKLPWQGRGEASLTALPNIPSIIVEPFFGSNPTDCARVSERKDQLARAILEGAINSTATI